MQSAKRPPRRPREPTAPSLAAESPTGHLVVIVSGAVRRQENVEVTTGEEARAGFAKVSTYAAIGPGGGILTQCTVRDDAGDDDISTAQYGIVYGQPVLRLTEAREQTDEHRIQDESRFQIEKGTKL